MLRDRGHEYGATTGRPRRCGWFDAVVGRYAVRVNGASALAIMKMDILDTFPKISICTGYRYRGSVVSELPMEPQALEACAPIYEEFEGWQQSTVGITQYDDLPEKAKTYLHHLSDLLETDIALISTGPKREQTIMTRQCDSLLKFGMC